jgi:hypothetical protein
MQHDTGRVYNKDGQHAARQMQVLQQRWATCNTTQAGSTPEKPNMQNDIRIYNKDAQHATGHRHDLNQTYPACSMIGLKTPQQHQVTATYAATVSNLCLLHADCNSAAMRLDQKNKKKNPQKWKSLASSRHDCKNSLIDYSFSF